MAWKLGYAKRQVHKSNCIIKDKVWFITFIAMFFLIFLLHISDYSPFNYYQTYTISPNFIKFNTQNTANSCSGRYIYMHNLPPKFNFKILENCTSLYKWYDICPYIHNSGLGPEILENGKDRILRQKGWFSTDQFLLEVIFHTRMKRYDCLTNDSSLASAIYVPFYGGLDLGQHLWSSNSTVINSLGVHLLKWLVDKPEWKKMLGGDHFFVAGRIARDYHRLGTRYLKFGGNLMQLPDSENLTMLTIESTSSSKEIAVPYPTHFHPQTQNQIAEWQNRMRRRKRRYLFAFSGAPRPHMKDSVRSEIISQCLAMEKTCKLLNCTSDVSYVTKCSNPVEVMKVFQDSVFCLQPPGDSYTRRSAFDAIVAGCIPVFFHPGSAYVQYVWYLPKDYSKYSVFIPMNMVKNGSVSIYETLVKVSNEKRSAMREEVVRLIPKVIYVDPLMDKLEKENVEDAFDIAVKRVLERIEKVRRNPSINVSKESSWKQKLSSMGEVLQWDTYFYDVIGS